jgi:hypothetical protein
MRAVRYNYRLRVSPAQERALLSEWDGVLELARFDGQVCCVDHAA